jgi:hypothetical protein
LNTRIGSDRYLFSVIPSPRGAAILVELTLNLSL